jgi:Flp pilus assembly protein TadD
VLIRSYDLDEPGGSGVTLTAVARYLESCGDAVWATRARQSVDEARAWAPDVVVGQQWATEEASGWATALRRPFVMLVHGPGHFEHFRPQCDLVVFNSTRQYEAARDALARTPWMVVHPPVLRADYETPGDGDRITFIGAGAGKGVPQAIAVARAMPESPFLFVTDDDLEALPENVEVIRRTRHIRQVYARTRLLLVPSSHESYGRVVVEAAMSGIPSVVSDLPGLREATEDMATFVGPEDRWPDKVAEALANYDVCRAKARRLAAMRDPSAELAALRDRLCAIVAAGRRRPTLTLCMTVANEAQTLETAVRSVAAVVDEIVIGVDSRSSDQTRAIAERVSDRCFGFTESSPPDFPRMRNRAMALVETDWAIVLDGHEWIEHADDIRDALETTAWSVEIQTLYEPDAQRIPGLSFPFPRFHRRHVRFGGAAAHEEVTTPCARRSSRPDIKVWHERKPGAATTARSAEKTGAELQVLRDAWLQRGDARALFYLANGLREAQRYEEAVEAYESYLRVSRYPDEAWQARLYLARCRAATGEWPSAQDAFEQAVRLAPERAEAVVGLGHALLAQGDARRATAWFRMATGLPEPRDCRMFVEVPLYRWGAWHGLALALDRLGDPAGAAEAELRAVERGAGEWASSNVAWWRARAAGHAVAEGSVAR